MPPRTNQDPKLDLGRKTIVLFGDTGTGKSLLYERFIDYSTNSKEHADHLKNMCMPLIIYDIEIEGKYVDLQVWKTTEKEDYQRLRGVFYANLDVAILCYAINNEKSYENIERIYKNELNEKCPNTPIILVANKIELAQSTEEKVFSQEQGHLLAKRIKAFAYVETSAKNNIGVDKLITQAAKAAFRPKQREYCFIL